MKHLLLVVFLFTSMGCAELVTYTLVSSGTFTGQVAHDKYQEYIKEKKDDDNSRTERVQKR